MELTQEYFDRQLEKLATKEDIALAIQSQTKELKGYIHESFDTQQQYIDERIGELTDSAKVKEDIVSLQRDMVQIKAALHLS